MEDWQPASWIPLQHLVWKETESGLTIILDCSNRYLKITNRKRLQTHGSRIQAGLLIQESDSMYHSKISACIQKLYDIDVTGYENGTNKLHLFDIESVNENIVGDGISFDKNDIRENLTLFLYPDDSDKQGELLRIYQQYFMVSNGAQFILKECEEKGYSLEELDKHVVIQINDTHPSMVIPELIRLLTARGISMDKAIEIVTNTCAYTNHTILQKHWRNGRSTIWRRLFRT